jgi:hypothetical protein
VSLSLRLNPLSPAILRLCCSASKGLRPPALIILTENFELIEIDGMKTLIGRRTVFDKKEFVADS